MNQVEVHHHLHHRQNLNFISAESNDVDDDDEHLKYSSFLTEFSLTDNQCEMKRRLQADS